MKKLHNWVITYNSYTDRWLAAKREHYAELFSGGPNVLKFANIDSLISMISLTGGSKSKLNRLVK